MDVKQARPEIEALTQGRMLDAVIEVTGHPAVLAPSIQLLRRLGRVVLLGDTPVPSQQHLGPGVVSNSIAILGIHGTMSPERASEFNPWTRKEMTALFYDYLSQDRMRVSDLVTQRASPLEAPEIYAGLLQDRSTQIGVIFDWERV
jgi:threonine dehydrogenase-like Zn-dependent dehydrogenase